LAASTEKTRFQILLLAFCLSLAPGVAIGFGRFGYALVLPAMRADLGWTYGQAGALNTANALGYLTGAALTALALKRVANRPVLLLGLCLSIIALFLASATRSYYLLLACRALVGFSAAFTFVATTGLAARLGRDDQESALTLGLSIGGPGIGTILTGALVPFVLEGGVTHWPRAWAVMGAIGLVALAVVAFSTRTLRSNPISGAPVAGAPVAGEFEEERTDLKPLLPILVAYFLFGLGYIAYMTFLVAYVRAINGSAATVALIWMVLGVSMVAATFVWKGPLARDVGGQTMAWMGFGGAASAILPLFSNAFPVLVLSAALFGVTTMPVFTAVTVIMRRHLPISAWNGAIAGATTIFALGQSLGPIGSGALSDHFGLSASLVWSGAILVLAALVSLGQKAKSSQRV
jgi:predicted MFS family arabinose efflux permease